VEKAPSAFRTISEVAQELEVPQHVLRFWESRFREIRPMKRGGGRRYYRPEDLDLLRGIRHLLYGEGYTIRGVQRLLREQGVRFVQNVWHPDAAQPPRQDEAEENGEAETALAAGAGVLSLPGARDTLGSKGSQPSWNEPPATAAAIPSSVAAMSREQVEKLRTALHELTECRRRLEAALDQRM